MEKQRDSESRKALTVSLFLYMGIFWVLFAQKIKILNSLRTLTLLTLLLLNYIPSVVPSGHSRDSCSVLLLRRHLLEAEGDTAAFFVYGQDQHFQNVAD